VSIVGPTFAPEELAGRKLIALFDRAEARDVADVFVLARHFSRELMLTRATEIDLGLDLTVLAAMMRTLNRFTDEELPIEARDVAAMRAYFRDWADNLG
jgi:predicted nucleotidyltransferase component of viral defense system